MIEVCLFCLVTGEGVAEVGQDITCMIVSRRKSLGWKEWVYLGYKHRPSSREAKKEPSYRNLEHTP